MWRKYPSFLRGDNSREPVTKAGVKAKRLEKNNENSSVIWKCKEANSHGKGVFFGGGAEKSNGTTYAGRTVLANVQSYSDIEMSLLDKVFFVKIILEHLLTEGIQKPHHQGRGKSPRWALPHIRSYQKRRRSQQKHKKYFTWGQTRLRFNC